MDVTNATVCKHGIWSLLLEQPDFQECHEHDVRLPTAQRCSGVEDATSTCITRTYSNVMPSLCDWCMKNAPFHWSTERVMIWARLATPGKRRLPARLPSCLLLLLPLQLSAAYIIDKLAALSPPAMIETPQ